MKNLILAIGILFSFSAQSQTFDGVLIDGDMPSTLAKFKAKGYVHQKTEDGVAILKGKVASLYDVELFVFATPKSKKVCKVVAYLSEHKSWYSIKSEYEKFLGMLTDKYGVPDSKYDFFTSPYFEGDGFEMTALSAEKCTYAAYWFGKSNTTISVEISSYKQVKLVYENESNMAIRKREIESLSSNSL